MLGDPVDIELERRRRVVRSPGATFSALGLGLASRGGSSPERASGLAGIGGRRGEQRVDEGAVGGGAELPDHQSHLHAEEPMKPNLYDTATAACLCLRCDRTSTRRKGSDLRPKDARGGDAVLEGLDARLVGDHRLHHRFAAEGDLVWTGGAADDGEPSRLHARRNVRPHRLPPSFT